MSIDPKLRYAVYKKTNGRCAYCGKELEYRDMTLDHVKARSKGGEDTYDNLLCTCNTCNHAKADLGLSRFRRMIQRLLQRLHKEVALYRLALTYGLVQEFKLENNKLVFYFETLGEISSFTELDPEPKPFRIRRLGEVSPYPEEFLPDDEVF